jgi:pimeloyl-ACP methyl ester carboxylesterase
MPRRPLALATLVLALLFALARATPGAVAQPGAPPLPWAPCDDIPDVECATFESSACPQTPEPVPALATARCGFLVVPENRAHPSGRMIRLAVAIIPAVSHTPAPEPIVYMAGGPGVDPIGQETTMLVDAGVNRDRDLIIMDQRGARYSVPALLCPEIDQFNARAVGLVYDAASTGREHVDATRACHDRLVNEGIDLVAYNTTENAADFADLRTALGIRQWNVYGTSYGTELALTYMREHPQGIRSVILDSVFPPDIASLSTTWSSLQEAFANIFAACEQQPACAQRYPGLSATFTRLVQELEAQPITTEAAPASGLPPVTVVIDGGALVQWLVGIGAQPAGIPAAIDALRHGNPQPIAAVRAAAADPALAGTDGTGLFYGAFCSEWIPYEPASEALAAGKRAFPEYPDSVLSQAPQLPFITDDCRVWNVPTAPAAIRAVTHSTIPTLIVSGTFDARTSPGLGEHATQTLTNSTVVNIPGVGHVVVPKSPCAQQVFASFLATPSAPDTRCVAILQPAPFN